MHTDGLKSPVAVLLREGMAIHMFGSIHVAHSNVGSGEITYKTWVHMPPKMAGPYP
jgi:hypothetical protein